MTFERLLELYPQASFVDSDEDNPDLLYLYDGQTRLAIVRSSLKETEIVLLNSLFPKPMNTSKWYQYFIQEIPTHNRSLIEYQVVQFKTTIQSQNRDFWLSTLAHYFDSFEDAFFVNEDSGLIVVQDQKIDSQSLHGFIQTMDDDFSSKTSLYIGEPKLLGENQIQFVKEERMLFGTLHSQIGVHSFKTVYLQSMVVPALSESLILESYRAKILNQQDAHSLIRSLWVNHANISQTSKDLFLHRNTLNYRLDRFYEEVGLSLRDLDDLLLCFLIIS